LDGSGYPGGLKGDEILLEAKIVGVADVVEAMITHRPFRPARSLEEAKTELTVNKGVRYDGEVAEACLELFADGSLMNILDQPLASATD
jgi:HD-GYP domain-containing protein (c-di-GMP phosphodiesterase class II)